MRLWKTSVGLCAVVCGLLAGVGVGAVAAAESPARKPNFILIVTDDQRWDMLSVVQREQGERARFPFLKTPNLDRLAAEGVRFRNAFVVNSLCAPSRATFLTGNYGHVNGIVNNRTPFSADNATWSTVLRKAGYATACIGKWHMGGQRERPGFDFTASFVGQGIYFDCPFLVNGSEKKTSGYVDDVSVDYALDFIKKNRERPFAMTVGLKATHGPFSPPPRRAQDYEGETARPVPNLGQTAVYRAGVSAAQLKPGEAPAVKTNLGYLRCIAGIDDNVGRVLKALDELGLAEDTLLVFCGDNGYYLGEHGLGDKRSAYEESLRIPLLLRYPHGVKAGLVDAMALNVDMVPTWLDFAGVAGAVPTHGRSWRPLLEGAAPADWRKAWFYCYFLERAFSVPMTTAVRTETAKLIKYPGHDEWTELFDLAADPYELKNLFADPAHVELRKRLEAEYDAQARAIGFKVPDAADKSGAAGDGAQPPAARKNAWVLDYRFDKDAGDKVVDGSGTGSNGQGRGVPLAEGRDGRKARRFDGAGFIDAPQGPALDPSGGPWTVEATFRAEKPDGIVLARGGKSNGYIIHLAGGRPVCGVTSDNQLTTVAGAESVVGRWVTVRATITAERQLVLAVDGKAAGRAQLKGFIAADPHDGMEIGADERSPVIEAQKLPRFTGLIESVRLFSGVAP